MKEEYKITTNYSKGFPTHQKSAERFYKYCDLYTRLKIITYESNYLAAILTRNSTHSSANKTHARCPSMLQCIIPRI